jgi:hypothetical protein
MVLSFLGRLSFCAFRKLQPLFHDFSAAGDGLKGAGILVWHALAKSFPLLSA